MKTLKIQSIKKTKIEPVYDIEIKNHNFILDNGVIAHNCAYSYIAYMTMYLKHHYTKEWWTAVLNTHIGKEDKIKTDLIHISSLLEPVSIKNPITKFEIINDKICCPLNIVKGIGPKVIEELSKHKDVTSFDDFLNKVNHRIANVGIISVLFKAGAFDCFINKKDYAKERTELTDKYFEFRKAKSTSKKSDLCVDLDLYKLDPLSVFLQEREVNTCFNKTILEDDNIRELLLMKWPILVETGNAYFPYRISYKESKTHPERFIIIAKNIDTLALFKDKFIGKEIGFIGFFDKSDFKKGISKKSGREWSGTFSSFSDGSKKIDCLQWDTKCNYTFDINSIIFIRGKVQNNFKNEVSIQIEETNKIELGV